MNKKIIIVGIAIIVISLIISLQQNIELKIPVQKKNVNFSSEEWNNHVTKILPRQGQIRDGWIPLWSDSSKEYKQGENPITATKTITKNEITSTSYNYQNPEIGIIQVLVWNGELFSEWDHRYAVENVLNQVNGDIEKTIDSSKLSRFCTVGYYELYQNNKSNIDLLFSECAKDNYRIRINLSEGEFNEDALDAMVLFSNLVIDQIK